MSIYYWNRRLCSILEAATALSGPVAGIKQSEAAQIGEPKSQPKSC